MVRSLNSNVSVDLLLTWREVSGVLRKPCFRMIVSGDPIFAGFLFICSYASIERDELLLQKGEVRQNKMKLLLFLKSLYYC